MVRGKGMLGRDLEGCPVGLGDVNLNLSSGHPFEEVSEANGLNDVPRANAAVVILVRKPERKNALLLEVSFVDTSKGPRDD